MPVPVRQVDAFAARRVCGSVVKQKEYPAEKTWLAGGDGILDPSVTNTGSQIKIRKYKTVEVQYLTSAVFFVVFIDLYLVSYIFT